MTSRLLEETPEGGKVVVSAWYPYIQGGDTLPGVTSYNQYIQDILQNELTSFNSSVDEMMPTPEMPYNNSIINGYQVLSATQNLVSLELNMSTYLTGAAHPYPYTITINYDLAAGKPINLADLFQPDSAYLERLSSLAKTSLEEQETLFFEDGLNPVEDNFKTWLVSPDGLTLIFDVYQVAPYAAGIQRVTIPFDQLSDILNADALQGLSATPLEVDPVVLQAEYPQSTQTPQG